MDSENLCQVLEGERLDRERKVKIMWKRLIPEIGEYGPKYVLVGLTTGSENGERLG